MMRIYFYACNQKSVSSGIAQQLRERALICAQDKKVYMRDIYTHMSKTHTERPTYKS